MKRRELNIRCIGGGNVPQGLFIRSGKLCILTPEECTELCNRYNIKCVIDLRTPVESAEFPDPLPEGIEYLQIMALLKSYGVSDDVIIKDYMRTNRNAFWQQ